MMTDVGGSYSKRQREHAKLAVTGSDAEVRKRLQALGPRVRRRSSAGY